MKAQARANRNQDSDYQADVERCDQRFEKRFNNAEAKAAAQGAVCPSHGDMIPTEQNNLLATSSINSISNVKTLNIEITQEDMEFLMSRSLNLNIAIKVNGAFNVIWRSVSNYSTFNQFQWSQVFHIFGTGDTEEALMVDIETNVVNIALGQDVVLDPGDLLDQPVAGSTPTGITFINNSESAIFPVLAQLLTFIGSTQAITPVYVLENPLLSGQSHLITPTQEVLVWFGEEVETGTIFTEPVEFFVNVDLTNDSSATRLFSNREWSIIP